MDIVTSEQALLTLNDETETPLVREKAIKFLSAHPDPQVIESLVQVLVDDDFGVRWEAALALSRMGREALIALLTALVNPDRAGNSRLRAGAYHAMEHMNIPGVNRSIWKLMAAIKGPAADIMTMEEAENLLRQMQNQR